MSEPIWVLREALQVLQAESLAEHGGSEGLRDSGLLNSALARAQDIFAYEGIDDPARLAAAYAFGVAKNHPFVDGNKRAAFLAAALFLRINGYRLKADQTEATLAMLDLAAGAIDEITFAAWLRKNIDAI